MLICLQRRQQQLRRAPIIVRQLSDAIIDITGPEAGHTAAEDSLE
jgi:hypothetical protein